MENREVGKVTGERAYRQAVLERQKRDRWPTAELAGDVLARQFLENGGEAGLTTAVMVKHLNSQPANPGRVVVLGSGGFVGVKLCAALETAGISARGVRSSEINLCLPESADALRGLLQPGDAVVFLSAITPDKGRDAGAMVRNVLMSQHVATALENSPVAHVIYVSSDAVFAEDLPPITESTPAAPNTLYGIMHLARETMLADSLRKKSTPLLILRPCAIYGPGDTHNSYGPNRFLGSARKDRVIKLFGQGEEKRPHLFVNDLVKLLLDVLRRRSVGLVHVAPGESPSFHSVAETVARFADNGTRIEFLPRSGPVTHKHFDPSLLLRSFPEIRFTPLEDGLREHLRQSA